MQPTHTFLVNDDKGVVSALHQPATGKPIALLLLAHGAGANMFHAHMQSLADALADRGIETLRYHFPYMEAGGGRTDRLENCLDTIQGAVSLAKSLKSKLPIFLAGHSFGGRMSSHFAAVNQTNHETHGLIYFSFPLHPSGKPGTSRADHLDDIKVPQLFLSGTRDKLAELELLEPVVAGTHTATLHLIDTADHSFKILKRSRTSPESPYAEASRVAEQFVSSVLANEV